MTPMARLRCRLGCAIRSDSPGKIDSNMRELYRRRGEPGPERVYIIGPMRILLTNDDGILAPGIAARYRELVALGDVDVVAPESVQSAAAHSITIRYPIMANPVHV